MFKVKYVDSIMMLVRLDLNLIDSIASAVRIFMYQTISKFKQVLRSRKGLDYKTEMNTVTENSWPIYAATMIILFMFKVKYADSSIMMLVRLDLNPIVSLFQHKCEVSETVSTTTLTIYLKRRHRAEVTYQNISPATPVSLFMFSLSHH